jgi:hypothetical protein
MFGCIKWFKRHNFGDWKIVANGDIYLTPIWGTDKDQSLNHRILIQQRQCKDCQYTVSKIEKIYY